MSLKGVKCTLHLGSKVLQLDKSGDLLEIFCLNNTENWYESLDISGIRYEINLFRPNEVEWQVTATELVENEEDNSWDIDVKTTKKLPLDVDAD